MTIMVFLCQILIFFDHHVIWLKVYQPTYTQMTQIETLGAAAMLEAI